MTNFLTVEGRTLLNALKPATAIIERCNRIPILSYVKLQSDGTVLRLLATDLDVELRSSVDMMDADGEFGLCVPANPLENIVRAAGVAPVRIEPSTRRATMRDQDRNIVEYDVPIAKIIVDDGAAVYELDTLPTNDFPEIPGDRGEPIELFSNGSLAEMIVKVAWAVSKEETRYYLNGVAWQANDKGRRFIATDGHRLASCQYLKEASEPWSRIIPNKTVSFILRHLRNADATIFATNKDKLIDIVTPDLTIRTKLIDGTYPNVDRVIPQTAEISIEFGPAQLMAAINQSIAIGGHRSRAISLEQEAGRLVIKRSNPDFGSACVKTQVTCPEDMKPTGFNGGYLLDILKQCTGSAKLHTKDHQSPAMISDEDHTMTRVIMPMRV